MQSTFHRTRHFPNDGFEFKEFSVSDAGCGMKLSSDAVLLGAYVKPPTSGRILDIGCGCGILSLMMAQHSKGAQIDAVEINEEAAIQARKNFDNSNWAGRIQVYHEPLQEFTSKCQFDYDCIISNPPYFHNHLHSSDADTTQSKHTVDLNFTALCSSVSKLLSHSGSFWVILPASERMAFINNALQQGLYCKKVLTISDKPDKTPVRNIFCLGKTIALEVIWEDLTIRAKDGKYSDEYIGLTKDYYL
jgi:tRNA1Val (adenine37-N6)-methyltransferase